MTEQPPTRTSSQAEIAVIFRQAEERMKTRPQLPPLMSLVQWEFITGVLVGVLLSIAIFCACGGFIVQDWISAGTFKTGGKTYEIIEVRP